MYVEEVEVCNKNVFYVRQESPNATRLQTGGNDTTTAANENGTSFRFKITYLFSIEGALRAALIISLLSAWIAGAAIQKSQHDLNNMADRTLRDTRTAYLVFTVIDFVTSIIIFILCLFNIINMAPINRINVDILFTLVDMFFLVPLIVLGIVCADKEKYATSYPSAINKGAFGASAFFTFLSAIITIGLIVLYIIKRLKYRTEKISGPS